MTNSTNPSAVLGLIRNAETAHGYVDFYRGSKIAPPRPLTEMTIKEVRAWQDRSVRAGSASSAAGGYQIIRKTLDGLVNNLGLTGDELFDEQMQDRMAMHLMEEKGYNKWLAGDMSDADFANGLAQVWAGLPTTSGKSFYAGDGLNAHTTSIGSVFDALEASRNGTPYEPPAGRPSGPPTVTPRKTSALDDFVPLSRFSPEGAQMARDTNVPAFFSNRDAARAEAAIDKPSLIDAAAIAINEEQLGPNLYKFLDREEFSVDPNFVLSDELWNEVSEGLDPVYQEGLMGAHSEPHLRHMAEQMRKDQTADQELGKLGLGGLGLRLSAAIVDPVAIGAIALTEGAAAPVIYGAKLSRGARAVRSGLYGAGSSAAIEGVLASQDVTRGWEDVALAGAAGFAIGGAIGALRGRTPEDAALVDAMRRAEGLDQKFEAPDGSIGAARVQQEPNLTDAEVVSAESAEAPTTAFAGIRLDRMAILKSSLSPLMRRFGGGMMEDGVGNADGTATRIGVSEKQNRFERVIHARLYRVYNKAYSQWLKGQGKRMFWQHGVNERSEFNRMVTMAVRRDIADTTDENIRAVAVQMKDEFAKLLQWGKDMGIRGFDEINDIGNYMVRRHRIDRLDDLVKEFGEGNVHGLVARSIMAGNMKFRARFPGKADYIDEIEYEDALAIAQAYLKSIRSRRYGEFASSRALAGHDQETLRLMLDDYGMAPDDVTRIMDKMRHTDPKGEKGRMGSAKWRLNLDELHSEKMYDLKGNQREVRIEEMFEDDAELLFGNYVKSVTAAGYMEEFLKEFRVRDSEGNIPAQAPSFETVKGYIAQEAGRLGMSNRQLQKEMKVLDNSYKLINGIPIQEASGFNTAQRLLRDYNFSRIGGQLGVAQLAELGNIMGNGGVRVLMQNLPALRKIFANARTGKFSDDFLNEIEAIWGFGTDLERMNMSAMFDESGAVEAASNMRRLDHGLQRAKKFTNVGSGMAHVNMVLQRLNARVLVQRFMDDATGARGINPKRMRIMGIDDAMQSRIQDQLRRHVDQSQGLLGKKVKRINIHKWDDVDAKNAFIHGVDRWAKKSIQENDIGNMPDFMSSEMGKTIFQFRSFMMAAYVKQTLNGIHHRDWEAASSFLTTMLFGGLFYVGQTHINSLGRDDRDEYLEDRLNPSALARASFQRSGFSSVIPMAVDFGTSSVLGVDPVFDFRSSGLKSGGLEPLEFVLSNPSADLIDGVSRAASGAVQSAFNPNYDFSERDFKAITKTLLFQNMFGIRNVLSVIGGELPARPQ